MNWIVINQRGIASDRLTHAEALRLADLHGYTVAMIEPCACWKSASQWPSDASERERPKTEESSDPEKSADT